MEEGIFIYLKSVQIRDIPKSCLLGADNTPDDLAQLIADGETITYVEGTNYDETWPARITKGRPYYPYDEAKGTMSADAHAEATQALFFYENMQGEGEDKRQDWKNPGEITYPDGNDPTQPGYKDNQPYGTYIEVKAYYRSIHEDRVGSGDIVYRFMMGKDVRRDYDAERNYHYKLTLHFNRFANDVDWHIDYSEVVPSIQVPPFFISLSLQPLDDAAAQDQRRTLQGDASDGPHRFECVGPLRSLRYARLLLAARSGGE